MESSPVKSSGKKTLPKIVPMLKIDEEKPGCSHWASETEASSLECDPEPGIKKARAVIPEAECKTEESKSDNMVASVICFGEQIMNKLKHDIGSAKDRLLTLVLQDEKEDDIDLAFEKYGNKSEDKK